MTDEIKELNLYQRLHGAMSEAGMMGKGGYNDHSKYTYVKAADVAKKFQELLLKYRVFCSANVIDTVHQKTQTAGGKAAMFAGVKVEYTFTNIDKPDEKLSVVAVGDGMDTGDKGIYKALTGSQKYLYSLNFCMGSDDDAETDSPEIAGNTKKAAPIAKRAAEQAGVAQGGPVGPMF